MAEKIYTIPVNDAFDSDCECPICAMYKELEDNAVEYTMGPSYMEDDIRAKTDALGFCEKHIKMVYDMENRLGFAWVMKTHMDKVIADIQRISAQPVKGKTLFGKAEPIGVSEYASRLKTSCFVCDRIDNTFHRYLDTVIVLFKNEKEFREKYKACKGFCTCHYGLLLQEAAGKLNGSILQEFIDSTNQLYLRNMERVRDDVAWFINKFDHTYAKEPWKDAKDAPVRAITKMASFLPEDGKKKNKK